MKRRNTAWLLLVVGVVLAVTLTPSEDLPEPHSLLCLWCNGRAVADMILNVVLFVPVGAALASWLGRRKRSVFAALALTTAIELAQFVIPGRDPNLGDVLTNTLGALLGVFAVSTVALWLHPSPMRRRFLALGGSLAAVTVLVLGSWLFAPAFQDGVYYGQWTADLSYLEWYRGQVLKSQVGDIPVRSRVIRRTDEVRGLLFERAPILIDAVAGPPVTAVAPIFSIYDDREREVLLIGTDREDAVLRYRMRAATFRLDRPDLRYYGAFAPVRAGDPLHIEVVGGRSGYCFTVNDARSCAVGLRVADTWGLLLFLSSLPEWARAATGVIWVAALFVFAGFWLDGKREMAIAGITAVAALAFIPSWAGILPSRPIDYFAAISGLVAGVGLRRGLQRLLPLLRTERALGASASASASDRTHLSTRS